MKDAPRETGTIREEDRSDDEITLPLRIICERRPETPERSRGELRMVTTSREQDASQKPNRAASPLTVGQSL